MKDFYNYLHIFSLFCLIYFLSIHESHCDHFLISDGEFGEVVSLIESSIANAVVGDATVLTQETGADSIKYFAPGDTTHPVFVTSGKTDVGKQQIVLSRGEDHLITENRDTFVVLRQKGSNQYTVHTAFVDALDRTTVEWTASTVKMMDGADIILELYGNPDRHHTLDTIAAPNCEWIGSSLLLCSPTTMEVRAKNVKPKGPEVSVPDQTGGGDRGDGSNTAGSGGEVGPKPTRPPRPTTGSGGGGSGTQTGGGGSGTQTGGGGSGTQTGGGGSGTQTGGSGSGTQTGGGGSGTQTGGGGSGTQTGGGGSGTQTGGGGSGTQTGGGGSGTQTGGGGSGTQTGGGGSGTQTGGGGSGTQTGGGGSGTQTGGGGSGTQTGGGGSGTQTGGGGSGTQTVGGGSGTKPGGGGGGSPSGNTGGGDNENMVSSGHGRDSTETFITFKEGDTTRSKGRKVGSFYSPRMKVHKRQVLKTAGYQPRYHLKN